MTRDRVDFVWVRPVEGCGRVVVNSGNFSLDCTRDDPREVTRGEWEYFLKDIVSLETCESPAGE